MTNDELCLRYKEGDTDAAEELISRNMGLIRELALRYDHDYHSARMDADDFTQEGAAALLRAASQFNPGRHVQFAAYARQAVRNAITDAIRANHPNVNITFLDDDRISAEDDEDADDDLPLQRVNRQLPSPYEATPEAIYIRKEQLEELYAAIDALSPRHHAWINCRYGFDDNIYKPLTEMSRIYHLSESRAKKTEDEAISKLRKKFWGM